MADEDHVDTDTVTWTETSTDADIALPESFAADDAGLLVWDRSTQAMSERFRFTEQASLDDGGGLLLERPLYALLLSNTRTAHVLDYSEADPDDETRETGFDVDL